MYILYNIFAQYTATAAAAAAKENCTSVYSRVLFAIVDMQHALYR